MESLCGGGNFLFEELSLCQHFLYIFDLPRNDAIVNHVSDSWRESFISVNRSTHKERPCYSYRAAGLKKAG